MSVIRSAVIGAKFTMSPIYDSTPLFTFLAYNKYTFAHN